MSVGDNPRVRQLRERLGFHSNIYLNDTIAQPMETTFAVPWQPSADRFMEPALIGLFDEMTGRPLDIHLSDREAYPRPGWGSPHKVWLTPDGYGVLTFLHAFGALPSDGVNTVFKLACPNGDQLTTWLGHDHSQSTIRCRVNGSTQAEVDALATLAEKRFIEHFT